MTTSEIQARIVQAQKNLHTNETRLNDLRIKRGQLSIEDAEENAPVITRLDGQIEICRKDIENAPTELSILEEQLTQAQAKESQAAKDALLSQQKSAAGGMEDISKKLVKALEIADDLNLQLQAVKVRYCTLKEQTGQDVTMSGVCQGSEQMLRVIYETCKMELEGIQQPRTTGLPPYARI